ncbi:MAG: FtsQ-type POTRA domain-containing protein [Candidatus Staskawiczbacteria bacterium]|nr:FtsQ-type POTRA domain-containing protein [Candidatus Staskawiczbacteria bacterium]
MSYRKKHVKGKIHNIKPKKSILKNKWFWFIILFLLIIFSAFYFILFYPGFQVNNIIIYGNQKVSGDDIKNLVSNDINNNILYVANSKSIFLINNDKINKEILNKFSIIEKLVIKRNFPQTLSLNITERKPVGIYCQTDSSCFSIDENGIIFEPASINLDSFSIRQILENNQVFTGEQVVNENVINAISKIQKMLKDNFKIDLKTALIASSLRLNIMTNTNWQIYFDLSPDSNINSQIIKLNLLLKSGISQENIKNLRYIDLRPKDRAIVCDNQECGG